MFLIVGLGNPGKKYERTRHNLGFHVIDLLSERHQINVTKQAHHALIGEGSIGTQKVVLAKPQTYMNESGRAVQALLSWHKVSTDHLVVVCDDLDLPPGTLRLRTRGSSAGHKGVQSIIDTISTQAFPRLRLGVGKVPKTQTNQHVLGNAPQHEKNLLAAAVVRAADAIERLLSQGISAAMSQFN